MKRKFLIVFIAIGVVGYSLESYGGSMTAANALNQARTSTGLATVKSLQHFVGQQLWYTRPGAGDLVASSKGDIRQVVSNTVEGLNLRVYEGVREKRLTAEIDPLVGLQSTRGILYDISRELALRWEGQEGVLAQVTPVAWSIRIHPTREGYLLGAAALLTAVWYFRDTLKRGAKTLWSRERSGFFFRSSMISRGAVMPTINDDVMI